MDNHSKKFPIKKAKFIIGGVVVLAVIVYLIYTGVQDTMVYYHTPTELLTMGQKLQDTGIRILGRVEDGTIDWDANKMDLSFKITDGEHSIPVIYHGIVPDTFKYGVEVVIEGKLSAAKTFQATKLLAKCPSKYEPED